MFVGRMLQLRLENKTWFRKRALIKAVKKPSVSTKCEEFLD
jgi:hypothetical protein